MPAEQVGEHAAEENAGDAAAGEDEAEDPHRLRPVGLLREERHDEREGDRGDECASQPLHGPRRHQLALRGREPAGKRSCGEERDADQEHPPLAEEVAQPPAEEEEAPEGEQVGVHDPRERGLGEAEVLLDRGQGDVHDRAVQHDHQVAEAKHPQCEPATSASHGHGSSLSA